MSPTRCRRSKTKLTNSHVGAQASAWRICARRAHDSWELCACAQIRNCPDFRRTPFRHVRAAAGVVAVMVGTIVLRAPDRRRLRRNCCCACIVSVKVLQLLWHGPVRLSACACRRCVSTPTALDDGRPGPRGRTHRRRGHATLAGPQRAVMDGCDVRRIDFGVVLRHVSRAGFGFSARMCSESLQWRSRQAIAVRSRSVCHYA